MAKKKRWPKIGDRRRHHNVQAEAERRKAEHESTQAATTTQADTQGPGVHASEYNRRSDMAIVNSAMAQRWPTQAKVRESIMGQMGSIALGVVPAVKRLGAPESVAAPYQRIAAARLYMTGERMNQVDEIGESPTELNINVRSVEPDDRRAAVLGAIAAEARRRRALAAGGLGGPGGGGLDGPDMLDTIDGSVDRVDHERTRRPGEGDRDP